jgi:hypothetical protein
MAADRRSNQTADRSPEAKQRYGAQRLSLSLGGRSPRRVPRGGLHGLSSDGRFSEVI